MTKTVQVNTEVQFTEKGGLELVQTTTTTRSWLRGWFAITTWSSKPVAL